jgi:hypothetical protein
MTIPQMKIAIRLSKDAGHSKLPVHISTLQQLLADAEKWRALPKEAQELLR